MVGIGGNSSVMGIVGNSSLVWLGGNSSVKLKERSPCISETARLPEPR